MSEQMSGRQLPWISLGVVAVLVILAWPPSEGHSLAVKGLNWLADPAGVLPPRPEPLAMGVDDDADVVTAHDLAENAYESLSERSELARVRLRLRDFTDPLNPSTERQILVIAGVVGAVVVLKRSGWGPA
jgi:hypothetical protein